MENAIIIKAVWSVTNSFQEVETELKGLNIHAEAAAVFNPGQKQGLLDKYSFV